MRIGRALFTLLRERRECHARLDRAKFIDRKAYYRGRIAALDTAIRLVKRVRDRAAK